MWRCSNVGGPEADKRFLTRASANSSDGITATIDLEDERTGPWLEADGPIATSRTAPKWIAARWSVTPAFIDGGSASRVATTRPRYVSIGIVVHRTGSVIVRSGSVMLACAMGSIDEPVAGERGGTRTRRTRGVRRSAEWADATGQRRHPIRDRRVARPGRDRDHKQEGRDAPARGEAQTPSGHVSPQRSVAAPRG